jgi:hypothetical protein
MNNFETGVYSSAQVGGRSSNRDAQRKRWVLGALLVLFFSASLFLVVSGQLGGMSVEATAPAFNGDGAKAERSVEDPFSRRVAIDAEANVYLSDSVAANTLEAPARAPINATAKSKKEMGKVGNPTDGIEGMLKGLLGGQMGAGGKGQGGAPGRVNSNVGTGGSLAILEGRAGFNNKAQRDVVARRPNVDASGTLNAGGRHSLSVPGMKGVGAVGAESILPSARPQQGGVHLQDGDGKGCWTAEGAKDGCGRGGAFSPTAGGSGSSGGNISEGTADLSVAVNEIADENYSAPPQMPGIPEIIGENVTPYDEMMERARALARRAKYYKRCKKYALIHQNWIRYMKCDRKHREKKRAARKMAARAAEMKQIEQGAITDAEVSAISEGQTPVAPETDIPESSVDGDVEEMEDAGFDIEQ